MVEAQASSAALSLDFNLQVCSRLADVAKTTLRLASDDQVFPAVVLSPACSEAVNCNSLRSATNTMSIIYAAYAARGMMKMEITPGIP
jgi:hypothetical protein